MGHLKRCQFSSNIISTLTLIQPKYALGSTKIVVFNAAKNIYRKFSDLVCSPDGNRLIKGIMELNNSRGP